MKITKLETFPVDAGWRRFNFCKITTDGGLIGWSEFSESFGSHGLSAVIEALGEFMLGRDPAAWEANTAWLHVMTRQSRGSLNQQAIGAIENACLDIAARALGIPVHRLFGGPIRTRIPLYWSHVGTYRVGARGSHTGKPPITTRAEVAALAVEARECGFKALKTNILPLDPAGRLAHFNPSFGRTAGFPELNWDNALLAQCREHLASIRDAVGPEMGVLLDVNFHFKTEGFLRVAEAVAPFDLTWLEVDSHDPAALAVIRSRSPCPIAGAETVHGRRELRPFLEHQALDTAIIDVVWNGVGESLKMAAMADDFEVNVAPHNYYGHLSSMISATFSACVPNHRIMEYDVDSIAWRDELSRSVPVIEDGCLVLPDAPGWGIEPDEAAIRRHAPK